MKTILIHNSYNSYNRKKDKWEWTVEVFTEKIEKHIFSSKKEAEKFKIKRRKENESK